MPAFLKLGDIKGASTDAGHVDWIRLDSMTNPITRSIPQGAVDQQRTRGETTLGDIVIVKQCDKGTVKIAEACATGKFIPDAQIDVCSTINGKQSPYMTYKLKNVIVTSYSFHADATGQTLPTDEVTLAYTDVEWTYVVLDPKTGANQGNVPGKYSLGQSKTG